MKIFDKAGRELASLEVGNVRDFSDLQLAGADFAGWKLEGANFIGTDLQGATFRGADLYWALFIDANCSGCNFGHAVLRGASFAGALLSGADLRDANLLRDNLGSQSDLSDLDLSTCQLDGALVHEAVFNVCTRFPSGFDPLAHGMEFKPE